MPTPAAARVNAGEACPSHRVLRFDNALRRLFFDPASMFGPYVRSGMTVLDVGCGAGFNCLGLARLVGDGGKVIAADVQPELLRILGTRLGEAGLLGRIRRHLCEADDLEIADPVGFVNAFWMVHETPDEERFLRQVRSCLRPGGHLFVAEPWFHVSSEEFRSLIATAEGLGFATVARPRIWFSRAVVLRRDANGRGAGRKGEPR